MKSTAAVCLVVLVAVGLAPATTRFSSAHILSRAHLAGRYDATAASGNFDWLLKSKRFQALSPAAKRAVRQSAGLTPKMTPKHRAGNELIPSSAAGSGAPMENIRVTNPALDLTYHTHSNSTIATDGTFIAIGFDDDTGLTGGYAISSDGGKTFSQGAVPEPVLASNVGDGVVAFAPNGTLFYTSLATEETTSVEVASSTDHGKTFSTPAIISGTSTTTFEIEDTPTIAADQGAASPFKGNVYVAWDSVNSKGDSIRVSRTTDGGATFQAPVALPAPPKPPSGSFLEFLDAPSIATGPNGELYVFYYAAYFGSLGSQILESKSTDGGATFGPATVAASFFTQESTLSEGVQGLPVYTGGQFGVASSGFPQAAADKNGNVGVVFEATNLSSLTGLDPSNIFFARSSDGGATFSTPLQLNDDGGTTTQWRPSIAVTSSGVFGVKWFDRRSDPAHDSMTDVYMAVSTNGGATFSKNFRVTDTNWLFGEEDAPVSNDFHGTYDTMTALGENFLCSWSDERSGKSDVYFTQVPASVNTSAADFSLVPEQLYTSVVAGGSTGVFIDGNLLNGFSSGIVFSGSAPVEGLSFVAIPPGKGSTQTGTIISITASTSMAPGLYVVTISGTGGGITRNTNLYLTVFEPGHQAGAPVNATRTIGNTFASDQSMAVDSAGKLHLCYLDDSNRPGTLQIFYQQSADGGETFANPVQVTPTENSIIEPQKGHSVSLRRQAKEAKTKRSAYKTSLVSAQPSASTSGPAPPSTLYVQFPAIIQPGIAVDPSGNNIYITIPSIAIVEGRFVGQILLYRSGDGGKTFSQPTVAVNNACSQEIDAQAIATDKNGNLVIAYVPLCRRKSADNFVEASIDVITSSDGGNTFSAPQTVSGKDLVEDVIDLPLRVAFDSKGGLYVLYCSSTGQFQELGGKSTLNIRLAQAADGAHFAPPANVYSFLLTSVLAQPFFDPSTSFPDVVIDRNGNIYVSFLAATPFGDDVYVTSSTDGGASFGAPANITNSLDVTFSSPFLDSAGNIGYLYTRETLGIFEGRSSDGGKTFFQTENISGHLPSILGHTEIVPDSNGNLYAYWGTTAGGSSDIYVCKFR